MGGPLAILLAAVTATSADASMLRLTGEITPIVLDYELPGHPLVPGRGHIGAVARASLVWSPNAHVDIEAGVVGRLPFALDIGEEVGALPVFSITARPFGEGLLMRFGSLDIRHGYHPAILDEARFAYGRNVEESYNRFIVPEAHRDIGGDPFPPAEHGAQLIASAGIARAEIYLDWQLLETETHREKFAFGVLGEVSTRWADLALQFRLTHYGGQLFTASDPIRAAGLDPVRQPETAGVILELHPLVLGPVRVDLPFAFFGGHMKQTAGGPERWHFGFEVGADMHLFDLLRLGYRFWIPRAGEPGFVSEDGDPVYAQGRNHRAVVGLLQRFGGIEIDGALHLVFPEGVPSVQYEAVTIVRWRFEVHLLHAP